MMSDWGDELVTIVEIDQPLCSLVYGESPCAAVLGTTGDSKCYNTFKTCQDTDNYDPATLTLRFVTSQSGAVEKYGPAIPSVSSVRISPMEINIGGMDESISPFGKREKATITFSDHSDDGLLVDKYRLERHSGASESSGTGFDPSQRGTYWGKWIARNPFHEGYNVRVYEGKMGDDLADMQVRNYLLHKIQGPDDGTVNVVCKDVFSRVERRKAKAPAASRGELASDITAGDSTLTLSPSGIGDLEYPNTGHVSIGDEIIEFSRSTGSDTMTLVTRGAKNTEADDHDEEDSVQLMLSYSGDSVSDIIYDLLTNYADVPASYIDKDRWDAIAENTITGLYTADIAEPTEIEDLVGELAISAGFTIWPDVSTNEIRIRGLEPNALQSLDTRVDDDDWIREGSLRVKRQPERRVSQVWVYYGQINPLESVDEGKNYKSRTILADLDAETDEEYGTSSIRRVWGRWIPEFGRSIAEQTGNRILSIFRNPPHVAEFELDVSRDRQIKLATPFELHTDSVQDTDGSILTANHISTRVFRDQAGVSVRSQELAFFKELGNPDVRNLYIDNPTGYFRLLNEYRTLYGDPFDGLTINLFVNSDVGGSNDFTVGFWRQNIEEFNALRISGFSQDVTINVEIASGVRVHGSGGDAGIEPVVLTSSDPAGPVGRNGGRGLWVFGNQNPVNITNNGTIAGGGGGGGGPEGGGGAGLRIDPGSGAYFFARGVKASDLDWWFGSDQESQSSGQDGTITSGGTRGIGPSGSPRSGSGGDLGGDGGDGWQGDYAGGSAGDAVDGTSNINWISKGTIIGNET